MAMVISMTRVTIFGARGSTPVSGAEVLRFGGQTTCFGIEYDDQFLIVDAGSGLTGACARLDARAGSREITILMTHYHMDHLVGLFSFPYRHHPDYRITIVSCAQSHGDFQATLESSIGGACWPVSLAESAAEINYHDLSQSDGQLTRGALHITALPIPHPQSCLAYRIESPDGIVVIATDVEIESDDDKHDLAAFCANADLLLFDAQFTPEEYDHVRGWGHSTWEQAARFGRDCGVAKLVLTHHDSTRTDTQIDEIVTRARGLFAATEAAAAGMVLCLEGKGS